MYSHKHGIYDGRVKCKNKRNFIFFPGSLPVEINRPLKTDLEEKKSRKGHHKVFEVFLELLLAYQLLLKETLDYDTLNKAQNLMIFIIISIDLVPHNNCEKMYVQKFLFTS